MSDTSPSPEITVSVRHLAAFAFPGGSILTASRVRKMQREGQLAQERAQADRPDDYLKEVGLDYLYDAGDVRLRIRGRMDGLIPATASSLAIIEEIKSTRTPLDEVQALDVHLAQARLYGALYCDEESLDAATIHLTYVGVGTGAERVFEYEHSRDELREFLESVLSRYIENRRLELAWRLERNGSIQQAPFPYENQREGQGQFMDAVTSAIANREKLFVRAPTGIGKTAAALVPALRGIADGSISVVFHLSARTTTQANAEECINRFRGTGAKVRSVTITAKSKVCFLGLAICEPDGCPFAEGYYARLPEAIRKVSADGGLVYTRERTDALAREFTLCPHELALDVALLSDVVIGDYNYAFDPTVYLRRFFQEGDPSRYLLLVDEAHNLVDRSIDMFSGVLTKKSILAARREIDSEATPRLAQALTQINDYLLGLRKKMTEDEQPFWLAEALDPALADATGELLDAFAEYFPALRGAPIPAVITELYRSTVRFATTIDLQGEGHRVFAELIGPKGNDLLVKLLCIDPSSLLAERTNRCRAVIFFSATLTPFDYFSGLLDGGEDVVTLNLDSPFPPEHLQVLVDSSVSTRYRDRERSLDALMHYVLRFADAGNCIFFFPSYAYLKLTLEKLRTTHPNIEVLLQERGLDAPGRREFLDSFVADHPDGVTAFAVLGGVFGEGIDLVGERLVSVVIVGVGLPPITNERNLMKQYYEERFGKGFHFAYTYPGMNRVLQAAGRVIRSGEDKGTVLFVGQRFGTPGYRKLFTPEYAHAKETTWS